MKFHAASVARTFDIVSKNSTAKRAGGVFVLKIGYVFLSLAIALLLARFLGPKGLGAYSFALSIVQIILMFIVFGLPQVVIRESAVYASQRKWGKLKGLISWCNRTVFFSSLIFTSLGMIGVFILRSKDPELAQALLISLFALPFLAQTRIRQAVMQGLHKVVLGNTPEFIIEPTLVIVVLVIAGFLFKNILTVPIAMYAYIGAVATCFVIGTVLLRRVAPKSLQSADCEFDKKSWFRSAIPLLWSAAMATINTKLATAMLGGMLGAESVGIYTAANRAAIIIPYGLFAINAAQRPVVAAAYAKGDMGRIQKALLVSSWTGLVVAVPMVLGFFIFGKLFLSVFGKGFDAAYLPLVILSVGQLFNNAAGSVGVVLTNCRLEKYTARSVALGAGINVVLNVVLIPKYGVNGAAVAGGVSMIAWNGMMFYYVRKLLGFWAGPFFWHVSDSRKRAS